MIRFERKHPDKALMTKINTKTVDKILSFDNDETDENVNGVANSLINKRWASEFYQVRRCG